MPKAPKVASKHAFALRKANPALSPSRIAGAALFGVALLCVPAALATGVQPAQAQAAQAVADAQPATADALTLSHDTVSYKEAGFFKRISEYFTGTENDGYRLILRTEPQQRAGLYFQALLSRPAGELPTGSTAVLTVVLPDDKGSTVYRFALPHSGKDAAKPQLWLGLTGENVPADNTMPLAWQLRIDSPDGNTLAETHSFLWSRRDAQ